MNEKTMNWTYSLGAAFVLVSFPFAGLGMFFTLNGLNPTAMQNMPYFVVSWTAIGMLCLIISIDKLKIFMLERKR